MIRHTVICVGLTVEFCLSREIRDQGGYASMEVHFGDMAVYGDVCGRVGSTICLILGRGVWRKVQLKALAARTAMGRIGAEKMMEECRVM